jgi:2Fe-2S type ferredoxin
MLQILLILVLLAALNVADSFTIANAIQSHRIRASAASFRSSSFKLLAKPKHKVTVKHNGKDYELSVAEDCSILDAAIDADIDLPYDCKMGVCLTCPSKLVSGKIDQSGSTLDESVMENGFALTCCAFPRSDLVIRSIDEEELLAAQFSDRKTG